MRIIILSVISLLIASSSCEAQNNWKEKTGNAEFVHRAIKLITDVMVHDIFSPPVASRTYAYISIAGYEAARHAEPGSISLSGQLHDFSKVPIPEPGKEYS
ncbi:MAG: phosphatidic acid phosphatase, partial [Chitinophagaceae bacterium]